MKKKLDGPFLWIEGIAEPIRTHFRRVMRSQKIRRKGRFNEKLEMSNFSTVSFS